MKRRSVLAGALALGSLALYSTQRGLRYPRLTFEPEDVETQIDTPSSVFKLRNLIIVNGNEPSGSTTVRAYTPDPSLQIDVLEPSRLQLTVLNVSPEAELNILGQGIKRVDEKTNGLTRTLTIETGAAQNIELHWQPDWHDGVDFAILGDTGGGSELTWCIKRIDELGVKFFLHLGDFHYSDGEYELAIEKFNNAPMPCYISIGNHDFNTDGLIYQRFLDQLGPLNSQFSIAGTRFINLDTALNFFPAGSGLRGQFFDNLISDKTPYTDNVLFTHRPLQDPRPGDDHHITDHGEIEWVANMSRTIGVKNYFNGHVHLSEELDIHGLHQYTVGEGLGFEDITHKKKSSKLLMGRVEAGQQVSYQWQELLMPWSELQSPAHEKKLIKENRPDELEWFRKLKQTLQTS